MDSRIKVKRWPGRPTKVVVRAVDLEQIGGPDFYRMLAEQELEPHMAVGDPAYSQSRPFTVTFEFDEGRTEPIPRPADNPGEAAIRQLAKGPQ